MNEFMNKMLSTKGEDYVIASDTDSIYVRMDKLVEQLPEKLSNNEVTDILNKFIESKIKSYMDACFVELRTYMNAYQQKMNMKRETIANKGIWRGKKMYILNALDVEGVRYHEPQLKLQGIEAVRSSTPQVCRTAIKKALNIVMNGTQEDLLKYTKEFKNEFMEMNFEQVAFPRSANNLETYSDEQMIYKKATPLHVKGVLHFNALLKKHRITDVPPVREGDKIKFSYLKTPNPLGDKVISCPADLPKQFGLDQYIDKDMQYTKSFLEPLKSITDVIGWEAEYTRNLKAFFS